MAGRITSNEAAAFVTRWSAVNDAERRELRAMSIEQNAQQLAALMASVAKFGWMEALAREESEVRDR